MNAKKLEKKIRDFLSDGNLKDDIANLSSNNSLMETGIIDSVNLVELIEFIENEYQTKVDEDDMIQENFD